MRFESRVAEAVFADAEVAKIRLNLRGAREMACMSLRKMAREIDVKTLTLSRVERGKRNQGILGYYDCGGGRRSVFAKAYAAALGIDEAIFYDFESEK
jgi:DNA-binding XRE family transcriptional regulator|tara:strand:- start:134 stop:427 length:294 start_codon:yes stop_codon:yes gene_type:complete